MAISPVSFESFREKYQGETFYNVTQLDQADKYLLAEAHGGKKSNPTNGEFISFLASKYFVICFCESHECMEEILDESVIQSIMKVKNIAPEVRNGMKFFGWDARKELEEAHKLQKQLFIACQLNEIDREGLNCIKKGLKGISEGDPFIASNLLNVWLDFLEKKLPDLKENSAKIQTLQRQLDSEVTATFPKRTAKMVTSLQLADKITFPNPSEIKKVWVCGLTHLMQMNRHVELNLDPLYQALQEHKAVAMAPKLIRAVEEHSLDEQRKLQAQEGKMAYNYQTVKRNPEKLLKEWEETIDRIRNMLTNFSSDGSHVT
jgi:hypothetical protein